MVPPYHVTNGIRHRDRGESSRVSLKNRIGKAPQENTYKNSIA